jgi:hypothetical protein
MAEKAGIDPDRLAKVSASNPLGERRLCPCCVLAVVCMEPAEGWYHDGKKCEKCRGKEKKKKKKKWIV